VNLSSSCNLFEHRKIRNAKRRGFASCDLNLGKNLVVVYHV
jgi:hypothetical protein